MRGEVKRKSAKGGGGGGVWGKSSGVCTHAHYPCVRYCVFCICVYDELQTDEQNNPVFRSWRQSWHA